LHVQAIDISSDGHHTHFLTPWRSYSLEGIDLHLSGESMSYSVVGVPGVDCSTLLRDEHGNALIATFTGNVLAISTFLEGFLQPAEEGGPVGFSLVEQCGQQHVAAVPAKHRMLGFSNEPIAGAQGSNNYRHLGQLLNLRLMIDAHAELAVYVVGPLANLAFSDPAIQHHLWRSLQSMLQISFPESLKSAVLDLVDQDAVLSMADTAYPPLGSVTGFKVQATSSFIQTIAEVLALAP
jgi:hypothetical protein